MRDEGRGQTPLGLSSSDYDHLHMPPAPSLIPPQFVFFDLDDTLLDHRRAERAALADLHLSLAEHVGHHALSALHEAYHAANAPLWADFAAARITADDLKRLRSERFLVALGVTGLGAEAFSDAYLARYATHWAWADGAREAFHATSDRVPVGVLTNGFREQQRAKLARFPDIEARASAVVVSDEVGVMKPHRALFDHALALAEQATGQRLAPADILLVGDSLASDVEGALGAGWQAVWIGGDADRAPRGVPVFATCTDWARGFGG